MGLREAEHALQLPPDFTHRGLQIEITVPTIDEIRSAVELVLEGTHSDDPAAQIETFLAAVERGEVSLAGLLVARHHAAVVGAVLAVCQPGGTAHVWPPRTVLGAPQETALALANACRQWVTASGAKIAQCLTQLEDHASQQILEQAGYERLTDLACWQHTLEEIPHAVLPDDCDAVEYSPETSADFERVMQATYIDSQDCAALHDRRSARDSLTSHELVADAESRHWLLYRCGDEDVGVVLCTDHRDQQMWELLYMGVVPKFRQQGFGLAMLCETLWDAQESGAAGLFLAADDANEAAAKLYDACGFSIGFKQRIHVWFPGNNAR